ncbi:hypothetical protein APY03_5940 [Variovorax sp. WDL1]|nr:hypothetical protein APY03_5940 [Variovorax sp. WDL1]
MAAGPPDIKLQYRIGAILGAIVEAVRRWLGGRGLRREAQRTR